MPRAKNAASEFTVEEQARLRSMMNGVWQYIGYDVLQLEGGKSIPRAEVIELVLDAGRLEEQYGREPEDAALLKRFRAMPYKAQDNLAKTFFRFTRYGM